MLVSAFITHKRAEPFSYCQDRFSVNPDTKSVAVSDGVSESIFQKYWAQILVDKYTESSDWVPTLESVRELSPLWREKVDSYLNDERLAGRNPWRAEGRLSRGDSAGATILGVRFSGQHWICDVLGDSCLVVVRDNHIQDIITSEDVSVFDSRPDYYDSNPLKEGKGVLVSKKGVLRPGDALMLVSDPFSDYLLKNKNTDREAVLIDRLLGINSHEEFEMVVSEWRGKGLKDDMKDDDSTLVIIKQDGADTFTVVAEDNLALLTEEEKRNLARDSEQVEPKSTPSSGENEVTSSGFDKEKEKSISLSKLSDPEFEEQVCSEIKHFIQKNKKRGGMLKQVDKLYRIILDMINSLQE